MDIFLGMHGLESRDEAMLRSMMRLLERKLSANFMFIEQLDQAHALIATPESNPKVLPHQLLITMDSRKGAEAAPAGTKGLTLRRPIGVTEYLSVLGQVIDRVDPGAQAAAAQAAQAAQAAALLNKPAAPARPPDLLQTLSASLDGKSDLQRVVEFGDGRSILIDPKRNIVLSQPRRDSLLAGMSDKELVAVEPAPGALDPANYASVLPLDALVWDLSHQISASHGVSKLDPSLRYRLRRWPDSSSLMREHYPRIAALLSVQARTVAETAVAARADVAAVTRFIEAAVACGIATIEQPVATSPPVAKPATGMATDQTERQRPFLGRLRDRLKLW